MFTALEDVNTDNILVFNKIYSSETKKLFIGYLYDDYKINPLHSILSKTSTYVKDCDGKTKWIYFLIKMMTNWTNTILFWIKLILIYKKT